MAPPPKTIELPKDCPEWNPKDVLTVLESEEALEEIVWKGLKMWHLIFLSISGVLSLIILFCCCVKFRIPRTKQEIEADYIRRKILRKFRNRLKAIQNQELDEMDLKKALDKIRAEFKSDTESLAQSEAGFSAATISSTGGPPGTYRRASQIQIDISLEELRAHSLGFKARMVLAFSRLCGRSKVSQSDKVALTVDAEGATQITVPEGFAKKKTSEAPPAPAKKGSDKKNKDNIENPKEQKNENPGKSQCVKPATVGSSKQLKVENIPPPHPDTKIRKEEKEKTKKEKEKKNEEKKKKPEKEKVQIKIENEEKKKNKKDKEKSVKK